MSVLLLGCGLPIWLALTYVAPQGPGWGGSPMKFVIPPLVLTGITVALHRLLANYRDGWATSMLLAGVIAWSSLWAMLWLARN